jgi:preprotein translocase subunit SecE
MALFYTRKQVLLLFFLSYVKILTMKAVNISEAKPLAFLKEVKSEMEKVTWPTKNEAIRLTAIVILASIIMGAFIGGLDLTFTKLMEILLRK